MKRVRVEWSSGGDDGTVTVSCVDKRGTFHAEQVRATAADELVAGRSVTLDSPFLARLLKKGYACRCRVDLDRAVYVDPERPAASAVVYESDIEFSDPASAGRTVPFPFHVLIASASSVALPMEFLVPAPAHDEFLSGVSLLFPHLAGSSRLPGTAAIIATVGADPLRVLHNAVSGRVWQHAVDHGPLEGGGDDVSSTIDVDERTALLRDGGLGGTSGGFGIKSGAKEDPKTFRANERTLLAWLQIGVFVATSAVQLLTQTDRVSQIMGTVLSPVAILVPVRAGPIPPAQLDLCPLRQAGGRDAMGRGLLGSLGSRSSRMRDPRVGLCPFLCQLKQVYPRWVGSPS